MSTNLPSIRDICEPREDVLSGTTDRFTANLTQVVLGTAPTVYQDPGQFFENTYPTEGMKTTIHEVFTRLSDEGAGTPVIKLETSLGGGKTHTLIALYHLANHGSDVVKNELIEGLDFEPMRVAAVVGTDVGTTLWGDIAKQLKSDEGYAIVKHSDKELHSPEESELRALFGKDKCLILIDEIALYLAKASAIQAGGSTLAEQTVIFLQTLTQVASSMNNVSLVITSLNKADVFGRQTEELQSILDEDVKKEKASEAIQGAESVLSRMVQNLTPTRGEEFPSIIRFRLFKDINKTASLEVCKEFHNSLNSPGVKEYVPKHSTETRYFEFFKESYPFHPEFIQILRTKTSSISNFNQTRGVLRLLSLVIKDLWDRETDTPLIFPHNIDFQRSEFSNELISRLDRAEYMAAVTADIADKRGTPRASIVDDNYSEPLGTMICTSVFLHSLTGMVGADVRKGCNEAEIQLAIHRPGMDPKTVENALKDIEDRCFYLEKRGSTYAFLTEPNLNKIIEEAKQTVEGTLVLNECERRIEQIFGARRYFEPKIFSRSPAEVPDDTGKPKLVLLHYDDCETSGGTTRIPELVQSIYEKAGSLGAPRVFMNNLLFLVADKDEKEEMSVKARNYLALKKLCDDMIEGAPGLQSLSKNQQDKLKEKQQGSELFLKVAVILAYKHYFIPTVQKNLEDINSKRPLRKISARITDADVEKYVRSNGAQDEAILNFLKDNEAVRTADDDPWAPDLVLEKFWPRTADTLNGDDFKKLFYKNPGARIVISDDLIIRAQQSGVQKGKWYAIREDIFYDRSNSSTFTGAFTSDIHLILTDSEDGKNAKKQFYCSRCGERKGECRCDMDTCPDCGQDVQSCTCTVENICCQCGKPVSICGGVHDKVVHITVEPKTMSGLLAEVNAKLVDNSVERIDIMYLKASDRDALSRLALAIPQFHGAAVKFELEATLNKKHLGGNFVNIQYKGDKKGFDQVKTVFINYDAKEKFSASDLKVQFKWGEGISRDELISLIRDKLVNFTGDSVYAAVVTSQKGGGD